jgi:carbon storage regulator
MLILSRKLGERIVIDDSIVVTVVRTRGGAVCLGIEAPAEVPVLRQELWLRDHCGAELAPNPPTNRALGRQVEHQCTEVGIER